MVHPSHCKVITSIFMLAVMLALATGTAAGAVSAPPAGDTGSRALQLSPDLGLAPAAVAAPPGYTCSAVEDFADMAALLSSTWVNINRSNPIGTTSWFQGPDTVFAAQAGAPTSYAGANYNNTANVGTISNWLITPQMTFGDQTIFRFYTRKASPDTYPDRLQVRFSTSGASTDVGTTETSTGDFSSLLLDVNPTLVTGVYPITWTLYETTITGVGAAVSGRLAFRYFVTNGGPNGNNSDFIGIDSFSRCDPQTVRVYLPLTLK